LREVGGHIDGEAFLLAPRGARRNPVTMNTRRGSGTRRLSDSRRVLIVDDNPDSAELLSILLEREGHETRVAYAGPEAIGLALTFRPNIAFLDIGLPGMDGFELLNDLRARPELVGCKFVAVTGFETLSPSAGGQSFDAHLLKPVDLSAVVRLVLDVTNADLAEPRKA